MGGSSSVTGTGGRGLDTESIIVTINTRIRAGGDMDWVMPLYSVFLLGNHIYTVSLIKTRQSILCLMTAERLHED